MSDTFMDWHWDFTNIIEIMAFVIDFPGESYRKPRSQVTQHPKKLLKICPGNGHHPIAQYHDEVPKNMIPIYGKKNAGSDLHILYTVPQTNIDPAKSREGRPVLYSTVEIVYSHLLAGSLLMVCLPWKWLICRWFLMIYLLDITGFHGSVIAKRYFLVVTPR